MRAILLAAGCGTRLRPLTNTIPKCLVPINGRPLIDYWLQLLMDSDITPILVNTHYLADQVREYLRTSSFVSHVRTVHEEKLLGTAGTLLRNRKFFGNEPVMLIHGDNLSHFDPRAFQRAYKHRPRGVEITMMTFSTSTPESCGIVELDERGVVKAFYEKVMNPPGNMANGAVYIVSPSVIDFLSGLDKDVIDFSTEVIPNYLGKINTFHNDIYHRDIGTLASLEAARQEYPQVFVGYMGRSHDGTRR